MARISQQTFAVTATGVGRVDYSQDVQYSVEPIIRSYQEPYVLDDVYVVGAGVGTTRTINVTIPVSTVVLLYDFIASQDANNLMNFQVFAVAADGTASSIFSKYGSQRIEHHHSRGAPVFQQIRIVLTNLVAGAVTINVTLAGVRTGVQEYYQRVAT